MQIIASIIQTRPRLYFQTPLQITPSSPLTFLRLKRLTPLLCSALCMNFSITKEAPSSCPGLAGELRSV